MIFTSFFKAIGQIGDARFQRVLWLGLGLTIALLIGAYLLLLWIIQSTLGGTITLPWIGEVQWVGDVVSWSSLALMLLLSIFLMVPVSSAITSLFLDDVAKAVEDKHYPNLAPAPKIPFSEGLKDTVNFLGVIIGANILALFVYAFIGPLAPFAFWAMNGYLLGMEYFQMAAMRRLGRAEAKKLRSKHATTIWIAGILMAMPLSIPLVNLLIPVLGAATFTHIFHKVSKK